MPDTSNRLLEEIKQIRNELKDLKLSLGKVEANLTEKINNSFESKQFEIENRLEHIERKIKKNNIVVFGLEINTYHTSALVEAVTSFFETHLETKVELSEINNIYTIGRSHKKPIVIEFVSYLRKISILKVANKLAGKNIFINHDLTQAEQRKNKILRRQLKLAKAEDPKAYIRKDRLYYNGEVFTASDFPDDSEEITANIIVEEKSSSAPGTPIAPRDTSAGTKIGEVRKTNIEPERKTLRSNSSSSSKHRSKC